MIRIRFRFPGGRYHATPWGRHVNEGEVEWPPSPWRISRALLAQGFNRLGWVEVPDVFRRLVDKLARDPPTYFIPPVNTAHSRHYVPIVGTTAKVLDAFAWIGRGERDAVIVEYGAELEEDERSHLSELLSCLPYLGRAESWVEAELVDVRPEGLLPCMPQDDELSGHERVALLVPTPAAEYARWRESAIDGEKSRMIAARGGTALSKKDHERLESSFPADQIEVIRVDTGALQQAGWSQPPGTRWVSFWRPSGATQRPASPRSRARRSVGPEAALLSLSSETRQRELLPALRDALWRMDLLHKALVRASDVKNTGTASPCFTGKGTEGHQHAFLLPLSLETQDRIDHVLVYSPVGFDEQAWEALRQVRVTYSKDLPRLFVSLVGRGAVEDFREIPHTRSSQVWRSATAFVPPRHLKVRGRNSLLGQLQAELEQRGLPVPVRIEVESRDGSFREVRDGEEFLAPGPALKWQRFRRRRISPRGGSPPMELGLGVRLVFESAVRGPIALGYGCHFGLGLMEPVAET